MFTPELEEELANHVREMDRRFYGLTRKQLMQLAYEFAERNNIAHRFNKESKLAGKNWVLAFCKRQRLTLRAPEKCSLGRAIGFNRVQTQRFFDNLRTVCEEKQFPAHRKFNMDETGISTVPNHVPKVISPKGKKTVGKVSSAERGQTVTAVCCMNPVGMFVPPAMIFPRKRMKQELYKDAPTGTLPLISDSGFITSELFLDWLKHFQKHVKATKDDPVLLILDNHVSHCSLEAIMYCRENFITLLSLPPHASHRLQPLDAGFFGPLKKIYAAEADKWMVTHPGAVITQYDVGKIFTSAYEKVCNIEKSRRAFEVTGIHPFNPEIFSDEDFAPSEVTFRSENEDQSSEPQPTQDQNDNEEIQAEPVDKPGPSGIQHPSIQVHPKSLDKPGPSRVPPSSISPLPKASSLGKRKRAGKKSEILSSSPFKNAVLEARAAKTKSIEKKNVRGKLRFADSARPLGSTFFCPGCEERYEEPITEDWIECSKCKNWWHEQCSNYEGGGKFICDTC